MDTDRLREITGYWSFWDNDVPATIPRDVALPSQLSDSLALVVQGVRRSGKSTLLAQMMERYRLDPKHCAFLNFEDPRLGQRLDHTLLDAWVTAFRGAHPRLKKAYFFLDEIQNVTGWEKWLRTRLERPKDNHFVVTGSNAQLLSGELASALTGRYFTLELFPFDLGEFRRVHPKGRLEDYLESGGFPEPLLFDHGDRLRQQYFSDIIERDVRERVGARSAVPIKQLVQMVFESAGAELSLRRLAAATGIAVDTTAGYLAACEAAYLLFAVPYFTFSERKRSARNKKYYPIDTGLRRMAVTRTGVDRGKLLECAVHLELRRRGLKPAYWRGQREVDFVVETERGIVPIQVSWEAPADRHERALDEFYEAFPQAQEALRVGPAEFEAAVLAELAAAR
ncbi:MAG TPA: ATP-binding protein [Vicinamibacteria bacterium]|nr:ATP-binding protein [Vicinamibacteria bacterium]